MSKKATTSKTPKPVAKRTNKVATKTPKPVAKSTNKVANKTPKPTAKRTKKVANKTPKPTAKPTNRVANKTPKPAAKRTKTVAKRPSVAGLATELKKLETRLSKLGGTQSSTLKDFETRLAKLAKASGWTARKDQNALKKGLDQLEQKIQSDFKLAVKNVRQKLRAELGTVTPDTLQTTLASAHTRLDDFESSQKAIIAKLNRHISGLATAIDTRLSEESTARKTDLADVMKRLAESEVSLGKRIDSVEDEAAIALNKIGDKVAEFAAVLGERSQQSDTQTAERLADLAQETQANFKSSQIDVTTRLEALETIAAAWTPVDPQNTPVPQIVPANIEDPRVDHMSETLGRLQDEISRLHARLATLQSQNTQHTIPLTTQAPAADTTQTNVVSMARQMAQMSAPPALPTIRDDNPYASAVNPPQMAETPVPDQKVPEQKAPEKKRAKQKSKSKETKDSHIPVEFDPTSFPTIAAPLPTILNPTHQPSISGPTTSELPSVSDLPPGLPPQMPPQLPPQLPQPMPPQLPPMGSSDALAPSAAILDEVISVPQPLETYGNPAYAEEDEMRAERIASDSVKTKKNRSGKSGPISGRNLRIGAIAAGVAVVGVFAGKSILGNGPDGNLDPIAINNEAPSTQQNQPGQIDTVQYDPSRNAQATAPKAITQTPQTAGGLVELAPSQGIDQQQSALLDAVKAGNPIAQFQMGLMKLQNGQPQEAARLIRLAANRNQPAAQYRLAKLYETGTGVTKDVVTARELVERAAIGGNRIAMHDLGNFHYNGDGGLEPNPELALDWFTKAAEHGVVDSQFNVAFLRESGEGVAQDLSVAYFWYNVAARQGDQGAPARIAAIGPQLDEAKRTKIESDAARFNPKPVDEAANGLFRDVPWVKQSTEIAQNGQGARVQRIKTAQTLLSDLGFDIGGIDGATGPKTQDAIREFQKINGMPETGEISDELIQRLEIAAGV